jgi:hypothetical protein
VADQRAGWHNWEPVFRGTPARNVVLISLFGAGRVSGASEHKGTASGKNGHEAEAKSEPTPPPPPPNQGKQSRPGDDPGKKKSESGEEKGLWEWANAPEQRPLIRIGLAVVGALIVLSLLDRKPPEISLQELKTRYLRDNKVRDRSLLVLDLLNYESPGGQARSCEQ